MTIYDKTQWNRPEWKELNVIQRRQAARDYLMGKRCYGGLDLSKSTDLTSFVLVFPPQDGLETWVTLFWGWVPLEDLQERERRDGVPYGDWIRAQFVTGCPGDIVDYTMVEDTIRQAAADFELVTLGLDPAMSWTLSQRLMASTEDDGSGLEVIEIPQTMLGMSPATKKLELMLRKREMLHEHNTAARWCFGNVRCYTDTNENMKPTKKQSMGRIDYAVAWIIAVATAMVKMPKGPDINEHVMSEDWSL